jgi:hypothetical protein
MVDKEKVAWEWVALNVGGVDAILQVETGWREKDPFLFRRLTFLNAMPNPETGEISTSLSPAPMPMLKVVDQVGKMKHQSVVIEWSEPRGEYKEAAEKIWMQVESGIELATADDHRFKKV